jgi:hypothetical protein
MHSNTTTASRILKGSLWPSYLCGGAPSALSSTQLALAQLVSLYLAFRFSIDKQLHFSYRRSKCFPIKFSHLRPNIKDRYPIVHRKIHNTTSFINSSETESFLSQTFGTEMSASSGLSGWCRNCNHMNEHHLIATCPARGCRVQWKRCQIPGGCKGDNSWYICKSTGWECRAFSLRCHL